jgi:ribosome-binding factor A
MEESKRQKQMAGLIQTEMSDIFQREGLNVTQGGMISIAQIPEPEKMLKYIKEQDWKLRKLLAARIKNQVRKIPVLSYYLDDTLEYAAKIDELFKTIEIPQAED